jgi:hypothetical protein
LNLSLIMPIRSGLYMDEEMIIRLAAKLAKLRC